MNSKDLNKLFHNVSEEQKKEQEIIKMVQKIMTDDIPETNEGFICLGCTESNKNKFMRMAINVASVILILDNEKVDREEAFKMVLECVGDEVNDELKLYGANAMNKIGVMVAIRENKNYIISLVDLIPGKLSKAKDTIEKIMGVKVDESDVLEIFLKECY